MRKPPAAIRHRHHVQFYPELLAGLGIVDQFHPDGLPLPQRGAEAVELLAARFWPLQDPGGLPDGFRPRIPRATHERIIDINNPGTGFILRFGFGDENDVVGPVHAGFQQPELQLHQPAGGDFGFQSFCFLPQFRRALRDMRLQLLIALP